MQGLIDWLVATPASRFVLDTAWAWPVGEALHFTGLVLLAGTVGLFDLRVLGLGKGVAPRDIHRLLPFGLLGFAISAGTGALFVSGTPDQYFYNTAFHFKLVFLGLMGLNAAFFYALPFRSVRSLGPRDDAPRTAKISAALSLAVLVGVMLCGRLLTFFRPPPAF